MDVYGKVNSSKKYIFALPAVTLHFLQHDSCFINHGHLRVKDNPGSALPHECSVLFTCQKQTNKINHDGSDENITSGYNLHN